MKDQIYLEGVRKGECNRHLHGMICNKGRFKRYGTDGVLWCNIECSGCSGTGERDYLVRIPDPVQCKSNKDTFRYVKLGEDYSLPYDEKWETRTWYETIEEARAIKIDEIFAAWQDRRDIGDATVELKVK